MRRRRAWADTRFTQVSLAAPGTLNTDLLAGLAATETKTVSRILVDLKMFPPVTNSLADRSNTVDIGIGVMSAEAFAIGNLPDPDNTNDYPQAGWIYAATQGVWKQGEAGILEVHPAHFVVDLRGQRKVDRGILTMVIINAGENGNDNVDIFGRVRALCLT